MKFLRLTLLIALVGGFVFMSSCGKGSDPKPSLEKVNFGLMAKTWVLTAAEVTGTNMTDLYDGANNTDPSDNMELTISGIYKKDINTLYNYELDKRPVGADKKSPWPLNGTWKFKDGDSDEIIIRTEDALEIEYRVSETQLQLIFTYNGTGYQAKNSAVSGQWVFDFVAK